MFDAEFGKLFERVNIINWSSKKLSEYLSQEDEEVIHKKNLELQEFLREKGIESKLKEVDVFGDGELEEVLEFAPEMYVGYSISRNSKYPWRGYTGYEPAGMAPGLEDEEEALEWIQIQLDTGDSPEGKIYPSTKEEAQEWEDELSKKAQKRKRDIPLISEFHILQLQDIAERGLPDIYSSFKDFMTDFSVDWTWDTLSFAEEASAMLNDPRFIEVAQKIQDKWGINLKKETIDAIDQALEAAEEGKKYLTTGEDYSEEEDPVDWWKK